MKILVPDYYPKFRCKCASCRHSCCNGWNITLSYVEYCKLLGVDCSPSLRRKLDCAFFLLKNADNERYVAVNRNYKGNCPLLREDGLCAVQCECGEEALPLICRMYPRNVTCADWDEGACSNGCERVIELLTEEKEGLRFIETAIEGKTLPDGKGLEKQRDLLSRMQDRSLPLSRRWLLSGKDFGFFQGDYAPLDVFPLLLSLIDALERYSPNFANISATIKEERQPDEEARYNVARKTFQKRFPLSEIWLENIFINHLFFEEFPHFCHGQGLFEQYAGQCVLFCILRYLCVMYTEKHNKDTDFVDCVTDLFRCFEHSDADSVVLEILRENSMLSQDFLYSLLRKIA